MASQTILTDAKLQGLKPPTAGQQEISDAKVPGLRIRIGKSGVKTFIIRKKVGEKLRNITVGRYGRRLGLAEARKKARVIISDIEAGIDPRAGMKSSGASNNTISAMWLVYLDTKSQMRSIKAVERCFEKYILPALGDRMADAVTRADVTRMIDQIASDKPVMARSVHAQLSAFYTWALPRLEKLPANPCRDAGRPKAPAARDRVLSEDELRALWHAAENEPLPWSAGLKLLILTGQRRGEVFNADRSEFDITARLWAIPPERAKNGLPHIVPLSKPVLRVLEGIPIVDSSKKLFPAHSNSNNGPSGFSRMAKRIKRSVEEHLNREVDDWRLHDLRRTMATGLQRLGVRFEVTEAVLNHVSGSKSGIAGVYQRHDWQEEKWEALKLWGNEVEGIVFEELSEFENDKYLL